ncbi:MAG: deoxyhypusine synthase family protein [Candidatus Micrarchaeota archaeon]
MSFENVSFKRKRVEKRVFSEPVRGFEVKPETRLADLPKLYSSLGFQATQLGRACDLLREARGQNASVFLSLTSNIVSSGLREVVAQLARRKAVHAVITSTGAVEEDFMKTRAPFFIGDFDVDDSEVKKQCLNRIGNVFVPDEAYVWLEQQDNEVLKEIYEENDGILVPSAYCRKVGGRVKDENSFLYWANKNGIPVFCPGFVDGAIGDHVFFFNQGRKKPIAVDQARDLAAFYKMILEAGKAAGLVIGGGIAKHHLIGAAILRNGLDYAVYVGTGTQYDGSLSGARPTEAVSWNKLKDKRKSAFVEAEATLVLPLLATALL